MSDFIFTLAGVGILILFALYARALNRL